MHVTNHIMLFACPCGIHKKESARKFLNLVSAVMQIACVELSCTVFIQEIVGYLFYRQHLLLFASIYAYTIPAA